MKIKDLRKESLKTQIEVANALGISRQVFSNYENEINYPDPNMLIKIADYFEVSIDYLVGRSDESDMVIQPEIKLTNNELEFLFLFRNLDLTSQNRVIGYMNALSRKTN